MKRIFIMALAIILSGCSSIPVSTMVTMSQMDETDFINMAPEQIRARIHLDEPARIDIEKTQMTFSVETDKGSIPYAFPLELLEQGSIAAEPGLLFNVPAKTDYLLALSDEAIANFKALQQRIAQQPSGAFSFAINASLQEPPASLEEINLSIFLKLREQDEFMTLFDNATVEINPDES